MVFGFVVHGVAALLIILLILVLLVLGAVSLVRLMGRGAKKVAGAAERRDT
jgi:hypothetical protein